MVSHNGGGEIVQKLCVVWRWCYRMGEVGETVLQNRGGGGGDVT